MKKFISLLICAIILICATITTTLAVYSEEAINFVIEHHLMSYDETRNFHYTQPISRAMAVTVFYRHWENAGKPATGTEQNGWPNFEDIHQGIWYSIPIYWAYVHGIVNGVDEKHFNPEAELTNEMLAVMLDRAGWLNFKPSYAYIGVVEDLGTSNYAIESMAKFSQAIGCLPSPKDICTREDFAYYLYMMWR